MTVEPLLSSTPGPWLAAVCLRRSEMDYAGATERPNDTVSGGTGLCGTTSGSDHPLCYLQATDGTVVITSYSSFISLDGLAAFCNELAVQLGTE